MPKIAHINVVHFRIGVAAGRRGPDLERDKELGSVILFPVRRIAFGSASTRHGSGIVSTLAHDRPRCDSDLVDADDYHRRMFVNLLALAAVVVLVITGSWAFGAIAKTTGSPHMLTRLASPLQHA